MLPAESLEPAALRPDAEYTSAVRVERRQMRRADAAKARSAATVSLKALAGLRAGVDLRRTFVGRGVPPEYTQELLEAEIASVVAPPRRKKWLGSAQDPNSAPRPYDFFFMPSDQGFGAALPLSQPLPLRIRILTAPLTCTHRALCATPPADPHTRRPRANRAGQDSLGYFVVNFKSGAVMAAFFDALHGRRWELGKLGTKALAAAKAAKAAKAAAVSQKLGDGGPEGPHSHCLLLFAPVQGRQAQLDEVARWQKHTGAKAAQKSKRQRKVQIIKKLKVIKDAPMLYDDAGLRQQ